MRKVQYGILLPSLLLIFVYLEVDFSLLVQAFLNNPETYGNALASVSQMMQFSMVHDIFMLENGNNCIKYCGE